MSKNRFTMIDHNEYSEGDCIYYDNGEEMGSLDVLDMLNPLSSENKHLKHKTTGLKSELQIWKEDADEHFKEINKLVKENKQLNGENKKLKQDKRRIMNYLWKYKDMDEEDIQEIFDNEYYDKLYFGSE